MKNENLEENNKLLINEIFEIQKKLISKEWSESRKKAFEVVLKMKERQNSLSIEQVRQEVFEQAERIKNERLNERTNG